MPTNLLDLSRWHPDFVPLSFYKMFGYPTGVGCLLARKAALSTLQRPWFAGGTAWGISVQGDGYVLLSGGEGFEDGTLNYLNLPAAEIGLNQLVSIGMDTIHQRVRCLTGWQLDTLLSLRHRNGRPLVVVYGPHTAERRRGTIALNFFAPDGSMIDERVVAQRASAIHLSLRTGCFCNPGAGEAAFHLSKEALRKVFHEEPRDTLPQLFQGECRAVVPCASHLAWSRTSPMCTGWCSLRRPSWIASPRNASCHRGFIADHCEQVTRQRLVI